MNPLVLAAIYLVVGLGCALPEFLRAAKPGKAAERLAPLLSALMTVVLWPLWAPFALAPRQPRKRRAER